MLRKVPIVYHIGRSWMVYPDARFEVTSFRLRDLGVKENGTVHKSVKDAIDTMIRDHGFPFGLYPGKMIPDILITDYTEAIEAILKYS